MVRSARAALAVLGLALIMKCSGEEVAPVGQVSLNWLQKDTAPTQGGPCALLLGYYTIAGFPQRGLCLEAEHRAFGDGRGQRGSGGGGAVFDSTWPIYDTYPLLTRKERRQFRRRGATGFPLGTLGKIRFAGVSTADSRWSRVDRWNRP